MPVQCPVHFVQWEWGSKGAPTALLSSTEPHNFVLHVRSPLGELTELSFPFSPCCVCVGGNNSHPSTMRCILGFCAAALPIAASFTARSAVHPPALPCQKQSISKDSIMFGAAVSRRHRTRRCAGGDGPANLDSSDDAPEGADDDMYASLRKRLEELEKSAPIVPAAEEVQV